MVPIELCPVCGTSIYGKSKGLCRTCYVEQHKREKRRKSKNTRTGVQRK